MARTARHALAHLRLRVRTAALVAQHIAPPRRARHHLRLQIQRPMEPAAHSDRRGHRHQCSRRRSGFVSHFID